MSRFTQVGAVLAPANDELLDRAGAAALPILPDWAPLDPKPEEGQPLVHWSDAEREHHRRQLARRLAGEGPYDGTRLVVVVDGDVPPAEFVPMDLPTCRYVLDRESTRARGGRLVYRYDPSCGLQAGLMRAVTEAYAEHADPAYAELARQDDEHAPGLEHRTPTAQEG